MRFLLVLCLVSAMPISGAAMAQCLIFCDETISDPAEALRILESDLGATVPEGITVIGMIEGGFQDRFIQAKLLGDRAAVEAILSPHGASLATLMPSPTPYLGPDGPEWWDWQDAGDLAMLGTKTATLPYLIIAVRPDPATKGMFLIYLWGFET
jgi:hypothetical protein